MNAFLIFALFIGLACLAGGAAPAGDRVSRILITIAMLWFFAGAVVAAWASGVFS